MSSVTKHRGMCRTMGAAAVLLPFLAAAESQLQVGADAAVHAAAHVRFKIIIPKVLYLGVDPGSDRTLEGRLVSVVSNNRNVALSATVRNSDAARGGLILSAAARKTIAEDAACTPKSVPAVTADRVVCTASMP